MNTQLVKLTLCILVNAAMSLPIFFIGGSFIFAESTWDYFGVASMAYAVLSCVLLCFTLINSTTEVLIADRISNALLAVFAFIVFVIKHIYEPSFLFALGAGTALITKWLTHGYIFKCRIDTKMA